MCGDQLEFGPGKLAGEFPVRKFIDPGALPPSIGVDYRYELIKAPVGSHFSNGSMYAYQIVKGSS